MPSDPSALLPTTKHETDKASALVQLGWPAVAPVVPQILEWLQDSNWPVSQVFQPFLVSIGPSIARQVSAVLSRQDGNWKYNLLSTVVSQSPGLARALRPQLERLAEHPSADEVAEQVDVAAKEILVATGRSSSEA
jgi:hypothetical protein